MKVANVGEAPPNTSTENLVVVERGYIGSSTNTHATIYCRFI